jgi:hypothetical protein
MRITIGCRCPCARGERAATSFRRAWPPRYERSHVTVSRPVRVEFEFPDDLFDPAALTLVKSLPETQRIWGETHDGRRGELSVPVFHTDYRRPLPAWLNQIVADWRDGTATRPPLRALLVQLPWQPRQEIVL